MPIMIENEIGWDVTSKEFIDQLKQETGDVEIHINSGGGSVFQGIAIFNAIRDYDKGKVTITITSLAASIASYIALAADEVKAYSNSTYMIHEASVFAWGNAGELRKKADIVESLSGIIANAYIQKTGKSKAEVLKLMNDETFFYGDEMKDNGFVDTIIPAEGDTTKDQAVALASEAYTACLKASNERITEGDYEQAAAMLNTLEDPKPTDQPVDEEGAISKEADEFKSNSSKVNAIKARLKLKEKTHG